MASKKFFVDIDLQKQQLKQVRIENVVNASGVSTPVSGQMVFDTTRSRMAFYNGTSWEFLNQVAVDTINYKGAIAHDGLVSNPDVGDMYIFNSAGTATNFGGAVVQVGDFAIYNGSSWDIIQGNVVSASESTAGIVRLATSEETITGTDNTIATSPANITAWATQSDKTVVRKRVYAGEPLSTTPNVLTHGIGSDNPMVMVYEDSTGAEIICDIIKGSGTVTVTTNTAVTATVVIMA
jgi:hypothetical protein